MNRTLSILISTLAALVGLTGDGFAQGSRPHVTRPVKDMGTYHVATKTWTPRETSFLAIPGDSIYDNTCVPQTIGNIQQINALTLLDNMEILVTTGQIPSTSNPVLLGTSDLYTVQGWRWAVCPGEPVSPGLTMTATIFFLESLASCGLGGNPAVTAPVLSSVEITGLPTNSAGACLIFNINLVGTDFMFDIQGDGEGSYDGPGVGSPDDTFGIAMTLDRSDGLPFVGNNSFGLAGDPGTAPDSYGCQDMLGNPGPGGFVGDSTSFQNPFRHVDGSTGFGTDDFVEAVNGSGLACFNISGGYAQSTPGFPAPWASLHCEVYGVPAMPPPTFTIWCNGDGGNQMGCTNCPCGNNTQPGQIGGCRNSAGRKVRLFPSGDTSVSLSSGSTDDLRFGCSGAPSFAFCILNSGDGVAPGGMANPCFGLNSGIPALQFDGLRCAIMNTRRHGGRAADSNGWVGVTNNPWGGEGGPPVGIAVAGGGFVAGQTRFFQIINRDDPLAQCMRGLNTSQAVEVTFTP